MSYAESKKFETVLYTSLPDSLRAEWENLWQKSPTAHIENSPGWFEAACEAFHHEKKFIATAYDASGSLVAVVPLVKVRLYGFPVCTAPGLDFITHTTILGDLSIDALKRELVIAMKERGTAYLSGLTVEEAGMFSQDRSVSLFVSDWEYRMDFTKGPFGGLSKRKVRAIGNRIARAPEQITVRFAGEKLIEALQTCFAIDQASTKHLKGKGAFWRDETRTFYTLLAQKYPSHFSIVLLYYGDTPIAYDLQFLHNRTYVESQKAYLPEYAYYEPGFVLFTKFIERVSLDTSVNISFGKGRSRFKTDFSKNVRELFSVVISKNSLIRISLTFILQTRERIYRIVVAYPKLYTKFKLFKDGFCNLNRKKKSP